MPARKRPAADPRRTQPGRPKIFPARIRGANLSRPECLCKGHRITPDSRSAKTENSYSFLAARMKHHDEESELLDSLFQEKSLREFRESLLDETLAAVRRKKRVRHFGATLVIAAILSLFVLPSRHEQPIAPVSRSVPARPFELVATRPLPATTMVETRSGNLEIFSSSPNRFAL